MACWAWHPNKQKKDKGRTEEEEEDDKEKKKEEEGRGGAGREEEDWLLSCLRFLTTEKWLERSAVPGSTGDWTFPKWSRFRDRGKLKYDGAKPLERFLWNTKECQENSKQIQTTEIVCISSIEINEVILDIYEPDVFIEE
jgi:hypothetical protein